MNIGLGIGIPFTRSSLWASIFTPSALFLDGSTQGVWYDPSDINLTWRRNLLTYSEQFDNAVWGKIGSSVAQNSVAAPDGTLTADKLVEDISTGVHTTRQAFTFTATTYTFSVYLKAAERTWAYVLAGSLACYFDLASGIVGSALAGTTGTLASVGGGWYLCTISGVASAISDFVYVRTATSNNINSYTGDGTSGIYTWGAQLEQGSTATPYQRITDGIQDYLQYQTQPVLYRDAAGTLPVTAVEQPVGLMLDKSKGLVLGPELVTNGDFSQGATGWTLGSGWSVSGGKLIATSVAFAVEAKQDIATLVAGSRYVVSFDVVVTSGTLKVNLSNYGVSPTELLISASGTYTYRPLQSGTAQITFWASSTFTGSIDNISVRELPGNHAFNSSGNSANFPVLSARYNVLNNTETLATQSVTTRAAKYILSFWGTGSVALSGTYTGTLVGTGADNRVYVEFTATAGTLTLTVTGSVLKAQLEEL